MEYASGTHIGRRARNEDSFYVPQHDDSLRLIAVADGMGGHAAGKRASMLAVEGLVHTLSAGAYLNEDPMTQLRTAIRTVNRVVYHHARQDEGCRGMGTTLALALILGGQYIAANIGDSRIYHLDEWRLMQVTQDHSFVAVLVQSGELTKEQANIHPQRNIITRAVGTMAHEEADYFQRRWNKGEVLMACSDGLHGTLSDEELEDCLRMESPLQDICDTLIERALSAGATDNISVVLAKHTGEDDA